MKYLPLLLLLTGCASFMEEPVKCYEGKVWVRPYLAADVYEPTQKVCKNGSEFK